AAAEQVDIDLRYLSRDRRSEGLASKGRSRDANPAGPEGRVLLINKRSVQQNDAARIRDKIDRRRHSRLKIELRRVARTGAGCRGPEREIVSRGRAVIHDDTGNRSGYETRTAAGHDWIGAGR